jgi:hypothetical protein
MAKTKKRTLEHVVSIDAYGQPRSKSFANLTNQFAVGQWCADFTRKDWRTLLAQLKAEMLQFDRAILALTKLAIGRGSLNQTNALERKQGRM